MAQFTITTPNVTGLAGSLITALDTALLGAGWTKPFTGTNKAVYRQSGGNLFYLRVQDDAPGAGGAKEARITGYEAMTDVDTGTNPFPTAAQGVGGIAMQVVRKSVTLDATNRVCLGFADNRTVYFNALTGDTVGSYMSFGFGDFFSLVPSDGFRCLINARVAENTGTAGTDRLDVLSSTGFANAVATGFYVARSYTGLGTSINLGKTGDYAKTATAVVGAGFVPFPNPSGGELFVAPVTISDPTTAPANSIRGRLRGFWSSVHPIASFTDGDTFNGVGSLSGKTFRMVKQTGSLGIYCIETSNTLETN